MPELLALYLRTRRFEREQEAERLTDRAFHASRDAAKELLARANRLREPEYEVETTPLPGWIRQAVGV